MEPCSFGRFTARSKNLAIVELVVNKLSYKIHKNDQEPIFKMLKLMVCVVLTIVGSEAFVLSEAEVDLEKVPFELDEWLNGTFIFKGWNGTWFSDNEVIYRDAGGNFLLYNLDNKTSDIFLSVEFLRNYKNALIFLSPENDYVLIKYNESSVYRHSSTAQFTLYNIAKKTYHDLANKEPLQLVEFAPKGHTLVYVLQNNIYLLEDFSVDVSNPTRVTNIGIPGVLYCGVPDWVYEEEVFASAKALWFSPNGTHLVYGTFNDEHVPTYSYIKYANPEFRDQYPKVLDVKYPKAGQNNPLVQIYLYDISTKTTLEFRLPPIIDNKFNNDFVFYGVVWISEFELSLLTTNRVQNQGFITRCQIDGACVQEDTFVQNNGWLVPKLPKYSKNGRKRLDILPQPEDDDLFFHLVLTDYDKHKRSRLTFGRRVVEEIYGWDEPAELIYYLATVNNTPSQQHLYVVTIQGEERCLSCGMIAGGKNCTNALASFNKDLSYYAKVCKGPGLPLTVIEETNNSNHVIVWEDNAHLMKLLEKKQMPKKKDLEVPVDNNFTARVRLWLPPNLDESSSKKYPAVVFTYAGPDFNIINDVYSIRFEHYLVTKKEYIQIFIDGRGSGREGLNKLFELYRKFATVEVDDQIAVTKYLKEHLPYIDPDRIGIWGWSYGGTTSSWALAKDKDYVFNFALAVAPVTNFFLYDTIYTERYMGLPIPEDNEAGYNNTDLTRAVERFRGRRFFIIHGIADDNVHFQNAAHFIKALESADIDFNQQSYPDENHQLNSVSKHVYHTIDKYFAECFHRDGPRVRSWNNNTVR